MLKKILLSAFFLGLLALAATGLFWNSNKDEKPLCGNSVCDERETELLCPEDCNDTAVNPEKEETVIETNISAALPREITVGSNPVAFVSIHLEPGSNANTADYPEQYWNDLIDLIALADEYEVHLTLSMNPQWSIYILADETRLTQVRGWEAEGHELAYHGHGPHRDTWNGYTNQSEFQSDKNFLGTIAEMMDLMEQVPSSGHIFAACVSGPEDTDPDWPTNVSVRTDGGLEPSELLSTPVQETHNGQEVWYVTNRQYAINKSSATLAEVAEGISAWQSGEVLGIVFHEKNYAEHPDEVEALFKLFQDQNVQVEGVSSLVYSIVGQF